MTATAFMGAIPSDNRDNEHMTMFFLGFEYDLRPDQYARQAADLTRVCCPFDAVVLGTTRMGPQQKLVYQLVVPHIVHTVVDRFKYLHVGDPEQIANWQPHLSHKKREYVILDTIRFSHIEARP